MRIKITEPKIREHREIETQRNRDTVTQRTQTQTGEGQMSSLGKGGAYIPCS